MINLRTIPNGCLVQLRHGGNYLKVSSIMSIDDGFYDVSFDNGATHKTYLSNGKVFFDRKSDFDIVDIIIDYKHTFNKVSDKPRPVLRFK